MPPPDAAFFPGMEYFLIEFSDFLLEHLWGGCFAERLVFAVLWGSLAAWIAARKHRSAWAWGLLAAVAGYWLEIAGVGVLVLVAGLAPIDLRRKYLEMKVQDQIFQALGGPSLVAGDVEEQLLMVLANNPKGLRLNALAQGVGQSWRAIEGTVEKLIRKGKIRKDGDLYLLRED